MTVRHVVSWKLADTDPATKAERLERIRAGLMALPDAISDIRALQVGFGGVSEGNWDLVLIADYDDADALARYVAHPEHEKIAAYIRSVVSGRAAVDFEV